MAVAAEVFRDTPRAVAETDSFLPAIPKKLDLPPPENKNTGVKRGIEYEQTCLNLIAESEPDDHKIFGPNLIAKAFRGTFFERDAMPDAMVFKTNSDESLSLIEISEFKLGKTESKKKVWGFRKLIGKIKTNQEQFNKLLSNATENKYHIPKINIPPNDEIIFTFATPRIPHFGNGMYMHDNICPVFYFYVEPES